MILLLCIKYEDEEEKTREGIKNKNKTKGEESQ